MRSTRPAYTQSAKVSGKVTANRNKTEHINPVETLKVWLLKLSETEQQELLDFLLLHRQQRKFTSPQERKLNMFTDSLSTELGKALGQSNRMFPLPMLSEAKKKFKEVEALMIDLGMQDLKIPDTKAMYGIVARVLVQHALMVSNKIKIPVSMKLVLQTTTPLHALIDTVFPGYIQSGLMLVVLKQVHAGITVDGEDDEY